MSDTALLPNSAIEPSRISSAVKTGGEINRHPLPRWKRRVPITPVIRRAFQLGGGWLLVLQQGNQSMKKPQKIALIGIVAMAACITASAAQAATQAHVTVVNQTSEVAIFGHENFFGSLSRQPEEIETGQSTTFTLSSGSNLASGMRFTYAAGSKKCRFTASHTAKPLMSGAIPSWKKEGESIGGTRAFCTAVLTSTSGVDPFNYSVQFTIR